MPQWTLSQPTGFSWSEAGPLLSLILAALWRESASGLIRSSGGFYIPDIGMARGCQLPGPRIITCQLEFVSIRSFDSDIASAYLLLVSFSFFLGRSFLAEVILMSAGF
jgi:hypothetical protein